MLFENFIIEKIFNVKILAAEFFGHSVKAKTYFIIKLKNQIPHSAFFIN
jgi:hypothetical protein